MRIAAYDRKHDDLEKKLQIRQNLWIIRLIESRIDQEVIL